MKTNALIETIKDLKDQFLNDIKNTLAPFLNVQIKFFVKFLLEI